MANLIAIDIVRAKVIEIKPKLDAAAARSDAIHRAVSAAQSRPLEDLLRRAKLTETDMSHEACAEILEMLLECKFIEDDFEMLVRHLKPSPLQSISKKKGKKQSQTYLPFHLYMNTDFQDKFLDQEISPAAKADFLYVFMGDCGLRHGCEYTYKRMNSLWLVHTETPEVIATMTAKSLWLMKNHVRDSFLSKHACFLKPPPSFCDELPENTATFLLQHPQLYEGILGKEPPPKKCLLKMLDVLNLDARYTCRNEGSDHERRNRSANSHNAFGTDLSLLPMHTARTAAPMLQDLCSQLVPALCLQLNSMFGDPSRRGGFMDASHHGNVPLTFNGLRRSNSDAEIEVLRDLQLDIQNRSYMRSRSTIATKERALPPALSSGPGTPDDSHPVVSMSQDSRQSQPSVASHEPILAPAPSAALASAAAPATADSPGGCIDSLLQQSLSAAVAPPPQSLSAAVAPPPPPAPPPPAPPAPPRVGAPRTRRAPSVAMVMVSIQERKKDAAELSKLKKAVDAQAQKAALKKTQAAQAAQAREENKRLYFKMLEHSGNGLPAEKTKPEEKTTPEKKTPEAKTKHEKPPRKMPRLSDGKDSAVKTDGPLVRFGEPCMGHEKSRSQVLVRTGFRGKGQTEKFVYGPDQLYTDYIEASKAALEWIKAERLRQDLA